MTETRSGTAAGPVTGNVAGNVAGTVAETLTAMLAAIERLLDRTRLYATVLVVLLALAALGAWSTWDGRIADVQLFATTGRDLLAGHWGRVYADPTLQAGPVILVLSAVLSAMGGPGTVALGGPPLVVAATIVAVRALRGAADLCRRPVVELSAAGTVALWELGDGGIHSGHLSQLLVPVLWTAAALAARRGRAVTAGCLLALASGCETWGVLALPVLLLAPARRDLLRSAVTMLLATAAQYLPFILSGSFRMFQYQWSISSESLFGQVFPGLLTGGFPWWARLLQAGCAVTAGWVVVRALRSDPAAVWAAPLAIVLVRLVLDPVGMQYYWTAAVILLVAGICMSPPRPAMVAAVACWWQFFPAGRIWYGTTLVSLPLLWLVILVSRHDHARS